MINYTTRLDSALRKSAMAHDKQYRKGTDIPYIIHPVGAMMIASDVTDDEDVLIACLMHDVLEDVDSKKYSEAQMRQEFGDRVVAIVKDVTKDKHEDAWRTRSEAYLSHLQTTASDEAVIVSASDKIHNLLSILVDYETHGDELWDRFTTGSAHDQLWWYESVLAVIQQRGAPKKLCTMMSQHVASLRKIVGGVTS